MWDDPKAGRVFLMGWDYPSSNFVDSVCPLLDRITTMLKSQFVDENPSLVKIPPSITYVNFHFCQRNYVKIPVCWWKSQFDWLKSDLLPFKNSISVSETICYTKSRLSVAKWILSWWLAHLSRFKSSFHFRVVSHGFLLVKNSFLWIFSGKNKFPMDFCW